MKTIQIGIRNMTQMTHSRMMARLPNIVIGMVDTMTTMDIIMIDLRKAWNLLLLKHPKPKKILLECGTNPSVAMFDPTDFEPQTFVLDRVLVDTSCLCRPKVKIEFSSIISYEIVPNQREFNLELQFQLFKKCFEQEELLKTWTYKQHIELERGNQILEEYEVSEPFTVTFCDVDCPDCCKYEMRVTSIAINDGSSSPDFKAVRVTEPNISALAQGIFGR